MFTGRYQISHGVMHEAVVLNPAVPTLGEVLKANGYTTAGFVSAPYVAPERWRNTPFMSELAQEAQVGGTRPAAMSLRRAV